MSSIHRNGDANVAGGAITFIPQTTVFANNLLVAINGSFGTSDSSCSGGNIHCAGKWLTSNGSLTVFAEGIPINRQNDTDTCGHLRSVGSPDVFVNN